MSSVDEQSVVCYIKGLFTHILRLHYHHLLPKSTITGRRQGKGENKNETADQKANSHPTNSNQWTFQGIDKTI